ncbi:vegetative cell wall protein gp1 [Drosophila sechellia]|uniref:GM17981 n=1 Tax=Drosophila sechellia TaxID=7238 RepID=B4I1M9_DROSE|nr:vegetative cell wall protein gp1 [Drosophila sechellia]EDW54436.1 GM17981 [Drosophila sechellia]
MMMHSKNRSWTLTLLALGAVLATSAEDVARSNRIAAPGEPLYYLMADAGPLVTPNEALKRMNRSLFKWWDDLFPRNNNNCCNNNNKLPEQFPTASPCGQCGGGCGQNNYVAPAPQSPSYGGDGYGVLPNSGYTKPDPEYNGPGNGDAGYVAPAAPAYEAPAPLAPAYEASAPPAPAYEAPAPPAPDYEAPAPVAPAYEAPAADYSAPAPPAPTYDPPASSYSQPAQPSYAGAPPAQIVYQPIIYLSTPLASKSSTLVEYDDQKYNTPTAPSPPPLPAPVYESPSQSCYQPAAPPAPNYATPSCQTPIRLSLIDQPYRVAPELFDEYNYRLALASQNIL